MGKERRVEERQILESWKAIADYLKRSIRTCRRWENELDLPIHRLDGTPSARVYAYADEIDRWLNEKLNHIKVESKAPAIPLILKGKWPLLAAAMVVVIVVLGTFIRPLLFPGLAPVPSNNPVLAILPFENPAGNEILEGWRTAFPDLLITDLRQSRYVNVIPVPLIINSLEKLKMESAKKFSAEDLTKIAARTDADFTMTGSLISSGEDIIVNVFIHNSKTKEAAKSLRANVRGEQGLLERADSLSKEIKRSLNLTSRQISRDIDEPIRRIATSSAQAFELYSQASRPADWKPFPDMVPPLQKAIALDPGFGLAYKLLFSAYGDSNVEEKITSYKKALELADRMSERERLLLQASFYHFYKMQKGYAKLAEANIPAATIAQLGPTKTGEILDVLERLAILYPDFFGDVSYLNSLATIYTDREEWDKAISVLKKGMTTEQSKNRLSWALTMVYLDKGELAEAEKMIEEMSRVDPKRNLDPLNRDLALRRRKFDDALTDINKFFASFGKKVLSYSYFSEIGYIHWLKDDMDKAGQSLRTIVDPDNLEEEWQRSANLAALCLSLGQVGQTLEHAGRLLRLAEKIKGFSLWPRSLQAHYMLAYSYRIAGRLTDALKEVEEARRDLENPNVPAGIVAKFIQLRALIALEMDRTDEFERQLEAIKTLSQEERFLRLMRVYYHLLGLRELKQDRGYAAIEYFAKALELSMPGTRNDDSAVYLYSLAEAYELVKDPFRAILQYNEISFAFPRESSSGDIYARSFYRIAKIYDDMWSHTLLLTDDTKLKAIENYRKFLSLWGDADPIFSEVADARARLAVLESK